MPLDPALDALYATRAGVPEHPQIFARWKEQATIARAHLPGVFNLAYGAHPLQTIDLFPAQGSDALVIFIHGGYWRSLDKDDFSFLAEPYAAAGVSTAMVNYRLCPEVTVADIVSDCRAAIAYVFAHTAEHGISSKRWALSGHSAGGHLVAMMYATDWASSGVDVTAFRGGLALSGLYDLTPMLSISVNDDLRLDAAAARATSPIHHTPRLKAHLSLTVGGRESSEFVRQSTLLAPAWPGIASEAEVLAELNHFSIVDRYADPGSDLFQRTLAWLR